MTIKKPFFVVLAAIVMIASYAAGEKTEPKSGGVASKTGKAAQLEAKIEAARAAISQLRAGEQINWQVIASGATDGSSTNYGLTGTVGQLAVDEGSSDHYGLRHGYWQNFSTGGGTCCMGPIRGNVDYDPGDNIDISDLVYLVDFMFSEGPEPPCFEEGDIDGSGSPPIDISDLVYLVDYMFTSGPAPAACP